MKRSSYGKVFAVLCIVTTFSLFLGGAYAAVQGSRFDPADYTALDGGAGLTLTSGQSVTFDTTARSVAGAFSGTGVTDTSESGQTEVAIFCFNSADFQSGSIVNVTGSRPCVILSKAALVLDTAIDVSGASSTSVANAPGNVYGGAGGAVAGAGYMPDGTIGGFGTGDPGPGSYYGGVAGGGANGGNGGNFYGGVYAGVEGLAYGDNKLTELLGGSGGGGSAVVGGGAGGGAVELVATGDLTIQDDGKVLADGGTTEAVAPDGASPGGGGSSLLGGANVDLQTGSVVSAKGGSSLKAGVTAYYHGGGGGGRIAIYYGLSGTLTQNGTVTAAGGTGVAGVGSGMVGTVFTQEGEPAAIVDGPGTVDSRFDPADYTGLGALNKNSGTLLFDTVSVTYSADGGPSTQGVIGLTKGASQEVALFCFDTVDIGSGCVVSITGSERPIAILSKANIVLGATLDVSGGDASAGVGGQGVAHGGGGATAPGATSGYGPGQATGHAGAGGGVTTIYPVACGGGGGFGGSGGEGWGWYHDGAVITGTPEMKSTGGQAYGDLQLTELEGGAGGGGGYFSGVGGAGGGAIELSAVGDITISGAVLTNGGAGAVSANWYGGPGSGGAILLVGNVVTIDASGVLSANGGTEPTLGAADPTWSPAGGGGRIAIYHGTYVTNGLVTAAPGDVHPSCYPENAGDAGTVFDENLAAVQDWQQY